MKCFGKARFIIFCIFFLVASALSFPVKFANTELEENKDTLQITILVDNYIYKPGTKPDWGFSCLVEGLDKTILFDTGRQADTLVHNSGILQVDLKQIDQLVISHEHQDHTGGIKGVYSRNPGIPAYVPISFSENFRSSNGIKEFVRVDKPISICRNAFLTGEMGNRIKEQSLIIDTPKGLVIITGCSHQGIIEILQKAKQILNREIYLVLGGFHLLEHSDAAVAAIIKDFRRLGVQKCGATHCTGEKQIQLFKKDYGNDFISMGTGRIIIITGSGLQLN